LARIIHGRSRVHEQRAGFSPIHVGAGFDAALSRLAQGSP
jgi:hypothetical protein